jgi:hypothetical protein
MLMMATSDFVTTGYKRDGAFKLRHSEAFKEWYERLKDGAEVTASFEIKKATRSKAANRFWWGVVVRAISEHTGYTPDEVHEWAKAKFIPKRVTFADGNGEIKDDLVIGGSSAKLNANDFYEFVENTRRFAAEHLDLVIPDPDPLWFEKLSASPVEQEK